MENERMIEMATNKKIVALQESLEHLELTLQVYRDTDKDMRAAVRKATDNARKMKAEVRRLKGVNSDLTSCLKDAVAAHKETGGSQDERWFQWARFILDV